jgi:hypothetical protein
MVEESEHTRWHRKTLGDEHDESKHRQNDNASKGSMPTWQN